MNAGRILRSSGFDTPELRAELAPIDPDVVNIWPAGKGLRMLWRQGIRGVTQGRFVFVHPDLLRGERESLARTVIHELVHVRQFKDVGYPRFMIRYVGDYLSSRFRGLSHTDAYNQNPAEVEAREVTNRLTSHLLL